MTALIAVALALVAAAGAHEHRSAAIRTSGATARAGQLVAGLTLTATPIPKPVPRTLPQAKSYALAAGITAGSGDSWLVGLNQQLAASHNVTYLRLMAEMNNCENSYAAYNCDGRSRGSAFAPATWKQAWHRVTLIMRGGQVRLINDQLRSLHMPRLRSPVVGGWWDVKVLRWF
ncbi:MAG: hypothetical protein ACP5H2_04420, partial [Solirubrobacteraceae bacterium]